MVDINCIGRGGLVRVMPRCSVPDDWGPSGRDQCQCGDHVWTCTAQCPVRNSFMQIEGEGGMH